MHDDTPLARIIALLDAAQIPHMLAGSFASAYYGAARATQDIDLVVAPGADSLERLLDCLSPEAYYVSREAAREALHSRGMFNIIDLATG